MIVNDWGQRFSQKNFLDRHKVIHSGEKPTECYDSEKSIICKSDLATQASICALEKQFHANILKRRFYQKVHL